MPNWNLDMLIPCSMWFSKSCFALLYVALDLLYTISLYTDLLYKFSLFSFLKFWIKNYMHTLLWKCFAVQLYYLRYQQIWVRLKNLLPKTTNKQNAKLWFNISNKLCIYLLHPNLVSKHFLTQVISNVKFFEVQTTD